MTRAGIAVLLIALLAALATPVVMVVADYLHVLAVEQSWYEGAMR